MNWETIDRNPSVQRAIVPGGWLVRTYYRVEEKEAEVAPSGQGAGIGIGIGAGVGLTFVPDENHSWKIDV